VSIVAASFVAPLRARTQSDEYTAALRAFGGALVALRSGDESASETLRSAGEELCARYSRCDAREVAEFYASMPREARLAGWDAEKQLAALRSTVFELGVAGVRDAAWIEQRDGILARLFTLVQSEAEAEDCAPAAGALSLRAVILAEQAEQSRELTAEERAELVDSASEEARRSLELFARAHQRTPTLEPLRTLGRLATLGGDFAEASRRYAECEALAVALGRDDYREHALEGRIELARLAGDAHGEDALIVELARFRSPSESWPVARDWGARLLAEDHAIEAAEFLERFPPKETSHANDRDEWDLLVGSARMRAGDTQIAREHFERVAQAAGGELAVLALASLALHEAREFEAIDLLTTQAARTPFSALGQARADALLGEAYARANDLGAARERLERARAAALEWERSSIVARDAELEAPIARATGSVIGERLGLHTVAWLADVLARSDAPLEAVRILEDAQSRSLRRDAPELTRDAILEWAGAYELGFVTWVVGADFSVVAHVSPAGVARCARIPRGRRAIEDAVRRLRELALSRDNDERWARAASDFLAEIVPAPIAESLRAAAANSGAAPRLLLSLHGPIESAPLEALPWETLCGAPELALLTTTGLPSATVGERVQPAQLENWSLLGEPVDNERHDLLPGARDELVSALDLHRESAFVIGRAFRRSALVSALRSNAPLHLATHLAAVGTAGAPGFVASNDEFVSLDDVVSAAPRLPVAVLSACWTGGGDFVDAEGLFGMARAFVASGTRNVVVTLWPVEDAAAAQFGAAFHRALLESPSPARACAAARRELARQGFDRAGWAAFRVLGRD